MDPVQPTKAAIIIEETGQSIPLGQDLVTIGRKPGNTIVLGDDLKVSRHHAAIRWETGTYIIQDVGSANGTFLNDQRLTDPQPLNDSDIVRVGDSIFRVTLPPEDTEPSLQLAAPKSDDTDVRAPASPAERAKLRDTEPDVVTNPYVGPRTFTRAEEDRFFGREREARELHSLIISERLVLFYAQSGAGKSSLLNTRVVPQLQEAGLPVLPIGRVGGELPEEITEVDNIFIFNLLLSLDESDGDPGRFVHMHLNEFLTKLTSLDGMHYYFDQAALPDSEEHPYEAAPYVLIIDQFEEIITNHPAHWQQREDFFRQLAQAMTDDPMLWVVLTMREDYVAPLDPYTHLLPGNLRARFYMQRMAHDAALEAVKTPAARFKRPYAPGVAEDLVDNLRQIRVHETGSSKPQGMRLGQFVEPVQLQVVCFQLWENLRRRPEEQITRQNLEELGDVDKALATFLEEAIGEVIQRTRVSEIDLRAWFQNQLITETGTRGTVYRGRTKTGGIPNPAVDILVAKFILRSEVKSGGTWYELIHDRFIEPILQSNSEWREKQPLIRVAQNWADSDRPASSLLEGPPLKEVIELGNWRALGPLVREYVDASQTAQKAKEESQRAEQEAQRQRELEQVQEVAEERQRRIRTIVIMGGVAIVLAFMAGVFRVQLITSARALVIAEVKATEAARDLVEAEDTATKAIVIAATSMEQANTAQETARALQGTATANAATAEALIGTATSNAATSEALSEEAKANAATSEALETAAAANASEAQRILEQQNVFVVQARTATAVKEKEVAIAAATAESKSSTATAIAAIPPTFTATPTPTPTETVTPVAAASPSPAGDTLYTPTATYTATPDEAATATAEAVAGLSATQTAVAEVNATQTVVANSGGCLYEPKGEFAEVWQRLGPRLGCPVQQPIGGQFAEQPFENGYMVWSAIPDPDKFFVFAGGDKGEWYLVDEKEVDSLKAQDGATCQLDSAPSDGLYQPIRGFGVIWCGREDIREQVGWGTKPEFGVVDNTLQEFENGFILRDSRGLVHVLFNDGTYVRIPG